MKKENILMSGFLLLLAFMLPNLAFAQSSYYELLKKEFGTSRDRIGADHIDSAGDMNVKICVRVGADQPDNTQLVQIRKIVISKQERGPNLPDRKLIKIAISEGSTPDARTYAGKTETKFASREITSVQKVWGELTMRIRRKGELLFFETKEGDMPPRYGYCYPPESGGLGIAFQVR